MDDLSDHDCAGDAPGTPPSADAGRHDPTRNSLSTLLPASSAGTSAAASPSSDARLHIPKSPNAFMLYRSYMIRSKRISVRVEGNHSTLSKIIGALWRKLAAHEREEWEDKARMALEEHKRRYPDWRFVNAQSRRGRGREGDGRGRRGRGRGKKRKVHGERVDLIRDLLVDGVEGDELERAVRDWDEARQPQPIASTSASSDAPVQPAESPYAHSPYQLHTLATVPPSPTSSYFPNSSSSLINWAGDPSAASPTSATIPSAYYPEGINTEFPGYYGTSHPAVTYEPPTPYENPYPYPVYSQDADVGPNAELDFLPVDAAIPLPQTQETNQNLVWTDTWQPSSPRRPVMLDQSGWEVMPPHNSQNTP